MNNGTRLAAVDLGSNSFRLEIVRLDHGQFIRAEYYKETIRQGGSLDADRNLSQDALERGWDCLSRFAERLAGFRRSQVRAVATQTLREARNRDVFLGRASKVLGFPIDVISGREEARLIYLGVAKLLPQAPERRLVTDIGGRSTELILGQGFEPRTMESYRVGSIAWSTRYFPGGELGARAFEAAEIAAKALLDDAVEAYRSDRWDAAYGSAGTVGAIADILAAAGEAPGCVTRAGLDWLVAQLVEAQHIDRVRLAGLKDDRRPILAGGVSILRAIFDLLEIERMEAAAGGLRHGLLCDLVGEDQDALDVRKQSIERLASKFNVDPAHGARVERVACELFRQARATIGQPDEDGGHHLRQLAWAAQLHEIGAHISHSDHHKHGAYILEHADAMGFAQNELHRLGLLVLGQRGKLRKLEADFDDPLFVLQLLTLRLAIILCHARRDPDLKGLRLALEPPAQDRVFRLRCADGWASTYPLSAHLLGEEAKAWQKTPWTIACLD